jgi:hypothetical protein
MSPFAALVIFIPKTIILASDALIYASDKRAAIFVIVTAFATLIRFIPKAFSRGIVNTAVSIAKVHARTCGRTYWFIGKCNRGK